MTSKTWTAGTTIDSSWLQDVNTQTYKNTINIKMAPYNAVGDGVTDDTAAIQAAVTAAAGGKVVFPPSTSSYLFREISVPSNTYIDLCGASCKLKATKVGTYHAFFVVNTKTNVIIENGVFDGNSSAQGADAPNVDKYAAVYLVGSDNVLINNNKFSNTYGNAHIRAIDGSDIEIYGNYHDGTTSPGAGTDLQPGFYYTTSGTRNNYNVNVSSNTYNHSHPAITDDNATQYLFGAVVSNNVGHHGTTLNSTCCGIRASDTSITGNTFRGGYFVMTCSVGAGLRQQQNLTISGNTLISTTGSFNGYGIEHYGHQVTITGNTLIDCGIITTNSTCEGVTISGNTLKTTLATTYQHVAISFGLSLVKEVSVAGNTTNGHGSFISFSNCTGLNNCAVTGNTAKLINDPGASQFFAYSTNATMTINRITILGNTMENAQRGFAYFSTSSGTLTVNRARLGLNTMDSNSFGLAYLNAAFTNSINEPTNEATPEKTITYSASMTPDAILGHGFIITATNGTAFTINAPTNGYDGQIITITLLNASGGALGAATWNAIFKMSAWTNPANGFSRSVTFRYNATNWVQIAQTGVDVPN